jgi:endonuclease/exonuclease/phosphatase family metal-dependent hydrolase
MAIVLVLSWNLFHGRSLPATNRSLYDEFAAKLGEWSWDVALLQEVPPWWPASLARELGVDQRSALTSRNALLFLRRAIAERRPELLKSNGGGCNAILSRAPIAEHRTLRLRRWPERRMAQLARLRDGTSVVNLHASTRPARAVAELARLWPCALDWAGAERLILGGDLNLRTPPPPLPPSTPACAREQSSPAGEASERCATIVHAAGSGVDHVYARGLLSVDHGGAVTGTAGDAAQPSRAIVLNDGRRVELSDHQPLLARLSPQAS